MLTTASTRPRVVGPLSQAPRRGWLSKAMCNKQLAFTELMTGQCNLYEI